MFVLGVDPGLSVTGYGVVEGSHPPRAVIAGVIRTANSAPLPERLAELQDGLTRVIAESSPEVIAMETMFTNRNLQTAMSVGRASGVVLLTAARAGLRVFEYVPTAVKSAVTGDGAANKGQVQAMVSRLLGLAEPPTPADAADALAIALCHLRAAPLEALRQSGEFRLVIGRIRGVLASVRGTMACVDVAGVGYEVEMTPRDLATLPGLGEEVVIHTHTHVREDDISLYGFASEADREMFRLLISASGVGPRLGLAMLGSMNSSEMTRAIVTEDAEALTVAPGVGKRGAQKIVLELAPKLVGREIDLRDGRGDLATIRQALEGLGYSTAEINDVLPEIDLDEPIAAQIKSALQSLGRR